MARIGARTNRTAGRGQTLLELLLASSLAAIALVPTLQIIRRGMALGSEIETRQRLTTFAVSKLEEHLHVAAATWTEASTSGSFASEGSANLRFEVERSEDAADGGIPDQLMAVTVTVWEDEDSDTVLDAGETQITFRSKIAKLAQYQNEAGG